MTAALSPPNNRMPPRFLIAPDKFKGSLSAAEAAVAIAAGIRLAHPDAEIDLCPIADGGEGFMENLAIALAGEWMDCPAVDALGREIKSRYLLATTAKGRTAILEMAETAGLWRLAENERDPLIATTAGIGMQVVHATSKHSVTQIILGLGGSATNDGGCGMAAALGIQFFDQNGAEVRPLPANLTRINHLESNHRVQLPPIIAACDVDNPLLGERGATAIFAAQKGAKPQDQILLEAALAHLVKISAGQDSANQPGAGAAGGLGFGLLQFADASLVSGFDLLAGLLDLKSRILAADHVITGEGSIDHQSLGGKGPVAIARLAKSLSVPVTAFCGVTDEQARASGTFTSIHALADSGLPLESLMSQAAALLTRTVVQSKP